MYQLKSFSLGPNTCLNLSSLSIIQSRISSRISGLSVTTPDRVTAMRQDLYPSIRSHSRGSWNSDSIACC